VEVVEQNLRGLDALVAELAQTRLGSSCRQVRVRLLSIQKAGHPE